MASFKDVIRQGMEAKAKQQREANRIEQASARLKSGKTRRKNKLITPGRGPVRVPQARRPQASEPVQDTTSTIVDQAHRALGDEALATDDEQ